ncbi:hypothetical protein BKA64DRAFT_295430 [Cadophora sp. MPI-SDFR-AT-0126]|nr:hypothetical protein BKA64DRAFT_295430 [Leotiomycetes sp. MPI-SDFR-AT-0126]
MTHLNQTDGLEDPFTGPRTASTRSSRTAAVRARGQQTMSALSQTLSSRLNSAKAQSAPAQDHKASSDFPPCPRSPVAINPVERSGSSMVPSLNVTLGARPTAPIRSFSASQPPSSRTNVSDTHGALRGSASSLSTSSSPVNSNTAQMGPQRSISGPSEVSSQPSLRSNVRKSSIAINQPAPDGVTQPAAPVARPRPSTNVIAQCPSSSPTSQRGPGSETPTRMLAQGQSSSPVPTVAAVHEMPPLPAGRVPYLKGFTVFPNLPTELQQEIWSIAIAVQYHKEKRFLRVAPDPKTLDRTDDDAEVAQLRIIADIHRRPRLVPSLLHVCQYTRNEAIKGYELWGCADPITYEKNHAMVYVKVDIDTFFFGDADLVSNETPWICPIYLHPNSFLNKVFVLGTYLSADICRAISGSSTLS